MNPFLAPQGNVHFSCQDQLLISLGHPWAHIESLATRPPGSGTQPGITALGDMIFASASVDWVSRTAIELEPAWGAFSGQAWEQWLSRCLTDFPATRRRQANIADVLWGSHDAGKPLERRTHETSTARRIPDSTCSWSRAACCPSTAFHSDKPCSPGPSSQG